MRTITVNEGFWYDEETFVESGEYEVEDGPNGYPMILVNGEWLDIVDVESL